MAANAVAEVPFMEQMDSWMFTKSPGKPVEDGFITVTNKKRGDIKAVKTSENNEIGRRSLCTECEIPHPYLLLQNGQN